MALHQRARESLSGFRPVLGAGILALMGACAHDGAVRGDGSVSDQQRDLYMTRTEQPQPSPELTRALELDVAPWHRKGIKHIPVTLPPEAIKESQQTALAAINGLSPEVAQNDFDRAWIVLERAKALKDLKRYPEAVTEYEKLLRMPRTPVQDWYAREALSSAADPGTLVNCRDGKLVPGDFSSAWIYPALAAKRGIGGWARALVDIEPDGSINHVVIESSSNRAFEKPVTDWLVQQHWQTGDGKAPGRRCFYPFSGGFGMELPWEEKVAMDAVDADTNFTYHSVGAAIRVRAAARAAILARQNGAPSEADKVSGGKASPN